jgi:cytochrome c556
MNGFTKLSVVAVLALGGASTVIAQEAGPPTPEQMADQATLLRQGLLKVVGYSFGPVGGMLRNKVPFDAAAVQKAAERVKLLATILPDVFQTDTRKFTVKTKAKENIWTNQADFATRAGDLKTAARALEEAAKGGDQGAVLKAAESVGKACGACHNSYRE